MSTQPVRTSFLRPVFYKTAANFVAGQIVWTKVSSCNGGWNVGHIYTYKINVQYVKQIKLDELFKTKPNIDNLMN